MPWRETSRMDERLRFVQDVHRPGWSIAEVCRRYEVSRKTGYKWLAAYELAGPAGLADGSHRPRSCPHATPPAVVDLIADRPERFMLFCDDLTFESGEPGYIALKVALDGSISTTSENLLIYATSNRRHLMPEYMQENLETRYVGDEIHPGETVEEKISLSERFGVWVSFYPFDQDEYLAIVAHWLASFGCGARETAAAREEALQWSLQRGSRSGRVAYQFARDWAGRHVGGKK